MNPILQELRVSLRNLLRAPGFVVVAVVTLALGIGANTSVFSLANALMLKPLPVEEPESLRTLTWSGELQNIQGRGWWANGPHGTISSSFPYPTYLGFREALGDSADVIGVNRLGGRTVRVGNQTVLTDGFLVSGNFFAGLGLQASAGRLIGDAEDRPGASAVIVLSRRFSNQVFGENVEAVGRSLSLDGKVFTVIGVLSPAFRGPIKGYDGSFYLPFAIAPEIMEWPRLDRSDHWWMEVLVRLRRFNDESRVASVLQTRLTRDTESRFLKQSDVPLRLELQDGRTGLRYSSEPLDAPLRPLIGAVGVILILCCANLAGLLMARGAMHRHQAAIESALGASRWRLLRRPLLECGWIALGGAGLSLLIAFWGRGALLGWLWPKSLPLDFAFDWRVLGFTFLMAGLTVLLFGLYPAWCYSRAEPGASLESRSSLGLPRLAWGKGMVSLQVALSLVLLVAGGLFAQSFYQLSQVDPGFNPKNLVSFEINAAGGGIGESERGGFYRTMESELSGLPGVVSVGMTSNPLISDGVNTTRAVVRGGDQGEERELEMLFMRVDESFFKTVELPLLQGREFRGGDGEQRIMMINRQLAETAFPGQNAIGQMLEVDGEHIRVIGVCADFKYDSLKTRPLISILPYRQYATGIERMVFYVRGQTNDRELMASIRTHLIEKYPFLPVPDIQPMAAQIRENTGSDRAAAYVSGGLAGLALVLSCIGLYGLMAYTVQRRTGELGIRVALGATRWGVACSVLVDAGKMAVIGIAFGWIGALWMVPLLQERLFEIEALDPLTQAVAALALLVVTMLACWGPARKATQIDPLVALRHH